MNYEKREKDLLLLLESKLDSHKKEKYYVEDKHASIKLTMDRVNTALNRTAVREKRVLILEELIRTVSFKIKNGVSNYEILNSLPAITYDKIRKYSKTSKESILKSLEKYDSPENTKKDLSFEKAKDYMNKIYEKFSNMDRKDLEKLEEKYTDDYKKIVSSFGYDKALGDLVGCLNFGMFGLYKKQLIEELNEKYRFKISSNYRLSDKMSDNLYKHRLTAFCAMVELCEMKKISIKKDNESRFNKYRYNDLRRLVFAVGQYAKNNYINETGMTPKDDLIDNFSKQITIEGVFPELDDWNDRHR